MSKHGFLPLTLTYNLDLYNSSYNSYIIRLVPLLHADFQLGSLQASVLCQCVDIGYCWPALLSLSMLWGPQDQLGDHLILASSGVASKHQPSSPDLVGEFGEVTI